MCSILKRIKEVVDRSINKKDVVAVVIPRTMAIRLADEIYVDHHDEITSNGDFIDVPYEEKGRYISLAKSCSYIGEIYNIPAFVDKNHLLSALDNHEFSEFVKLRESN